MQKLLQYTLIFFTSTILPIFSFPSFGKDCPLVPENIKILTVKNAQATIRTEPKYGDRNKGPAIDTNDELIVVSRSPKAGPDKNSNILCWYQVRPIKNGSKYYYWIPEVGIKEFPFQATRRSFFSPNYSNASDQDTNNQNQSQTIDQINPTSSWLLSALIGISVLSLGTFIFSLLTFLDQKRKIAKITKTIYKIENNINQSYQQLFTKIPLENNRQLESYYQRTKAKFQGISEQISQLKKTNFSQGQSVSTSPNFSDSPSASANYHSNSLDTPQTYEPIKREIDEIIQQFNDQNRDYFNNSQFQPLNLTKISSQGAIGEDGRRIIQLEPINDVNQSLFLQILADRENWLIPNIISLYIRNIMNNLEQYPEIFTIHSGSGILQLLKAAKLKDIGFNLWEIEELGEFTQGEIIGQNIVPVIDSKSFYNSSFQNTDLISSSSYEKNTSGILELDLAVLNFLRKNEQASFLDFLSNLKCNEQDLLDRLLALQEENFIELVEQIDKNNPIYRMC